MNIQEKIEYLLKMGYTWEQIESLLDIEVSVNVVNVEYITQVIHTQSLGSFEVNVN